MTAYLYDRLGDEAFWQLIYALRDSGFQTALHECARMSPTIYGKPGAGHSGKLP